MPYISATGLPPAVADAKAQPQQQQRVAADSPPAAAPGTPAPAAAQTFPLLGIQLPDRTPLPASVVTSEFPLIGATTTGELRFQPGDSIKASIWGYPELDHVAIVQVNGNITLPLVGEIEAAGVTQSELHARIVERLEPFTKVREPGLRPGDSLTLEVWQHPELRHVAVIEPSGVATFPLAGSVPASGRSVEEIRKDVHGRLLAHLREARVSVLPAYNNRRVLAELNVSVVPTALEPRRVAVIGEVGSAGVADIKGSLRLVEALARAQLRDSTAEINSVVVIRSSGPNHASYRVLRLRDYFEGRAPDQNIYLQHGDVVIVPRTQIARAGEFVEQFFTRTAPVFQWFFGAYEMLSAPARFDTIRLINESLRRSIQGVSITPP